MSTITSSISSALSDLPAVGSSSVGSTTAGASKDMGEADFMKLLITQMQYQDPLNPVDNTQMLAQLAQFSQLSAIEKLSTQMGSMVAATNSGAELSATQLVGKQVAFQGNQIALTSGSTSTFDIELPQSTAATTAVISDAGGNVVRTLHLGAGVPGTNTVTWDGRSDSGAACPTAQYSLSVSGTTSSGSAVQATANVRAMVAGVDLSSGTAMLIVGGQEIGLSKVTAVYSVSTGS